MMEQPLLLDSSQYVNPTGAVVTQQTVAAEVPHDVQMELMLRNPSKKPAGLVMPHLASAKDMLFTSMTLYSKPDPVPPPAPVYAPPMVPSQVMHMQYAPPPPPAIPTLARFS